MLARELRKTRVDEVLVRQLCKSVRHLDSGARRDAAMTLCSNFESLYPVFPTVALILKDVLPALQGEDRSVVYSTLRDLMRSGSHIVAVPANALYCLRAMVDDPDEEVDRLLLPYLRSSQSLAMRRDSVLCLARRASKARLADLLRTHPLPTDWQLRSLIVASYVLGDEGRHWRRNVKRQFSVVDQAFMQWIAKKYSGKTWEIPI